MALQSERTVLTAGGLLAALLALRLLIPNGWDATAFIAFGEDAPEQTEHAESLIGPVAEREAMGHDGRFFFIQALDPLYREPEEHAVHLDRPVYRAQRMLYPLLAGLAGMTPPDLVPWTMLAMNLAALVGGTWLLARYATNRGLTPWLGLAFVLNLGLVSELYVSGAGITAMLGLVAAAWRLEQEDVRSSALWLTVSALAREVMLLAVLGAAWFQWRRERRVSLCWATPFLGVGAWALYIRARLGWESGLGEVQEIVLLPFSGLVEAAAAWLEEPFLLVVGGVVMIVLVRFGGIAGRSHLALTWMALPFALLAIFLASQVWTQYYDITRAIAPVLSAYLVEVAARGSRSASNPARVGT